MSRFIKKRRFNSFSRRSRQPRSPWEKQENAIFIARAAGRNDLARDLASMSAYDFNKTFKGC